MFHPHFAQSTNKYKLFQTLYHNTQSKIIGSSKNSNIKQICYQFGLSNGEILIDFNLLKSIYRLY